MSGRQEAQIMVLFALSIVGLTALLALVVDGGFLYLQRRTAQTAADAGALAGARALREHAALTSIRDAASSAAQANAFGVQPTVQCMYLVDASGTPAGGLYAAAGATCPGGWASTINGTSGVHVDVRVSFPTILLGMLRIPSLNADASATAQLGAPGTFNASNSPLIVCGGGAGSAMRVAPGALTAGYAPPVSTANGQVSPPDRLPTYRVSGSGGGGVADQILLADGSGLDTAKNGYVYYLKGSAIGSYGTDCGAGSNKFDGGALAGQGLIVLPGSLIGSNGNNVASISQQVEMPGGCAAGTDILSWTAGSPGCVFMLPVANGSTSANPPTLTIPLLAPFYVWCNQSSTAGTGCQEFVGQLIENLAGTGNSLIAVTVSDRAAPGGLVAVHLTG